MFDGEAFGAEIVAHVKSHVSNSIAPLLAEISLLKSSNVELSSKIAELEKREPLRGEKGEKGDVGPSGPPGESVIGMKGDPGSAIICGKGEPEHDGKPGDIFLDVETGNLYQFKS